MRNTNPVVSIIVTIVPLILIVWYFDFIQRKLGGLDPIVLAFVSLGFGLLLSWRLTVIGVILLSPGLGDEEKLRVSAIVLMDRLLSKAGSQDLDTREKYQLQSAIMSYFMTGTSQKTAKKYLNRMNALTGKLEPEFVRQTERVFEERFGR